VCGCMSDIKHNYNDIKPDKVINELKLKIIAQ